MAKTIQVSRHVFDLGEGEVELEYTFSSKSFIKIFLNLRFENDLERESLLQISPSKPLIIRILFWLFTNNDTHTYLLCFPENEI